MRKIILTTAGAVVICLLLASVARAQAVDAPKAEVAVLFSTITLTPSDGYRSEIGFGGRVTYNVTDRFGLEAETSFFPNSGRSAESRASGRAVEGLFGAKFGKRWEKFGVFAKARPGFISFSRGRLERDPVSSLPSFIVFSESRATHFAFDAGGVLEFYPTRRVVTRFDAGDTIIRYGSQTVATGLAPPSSPTFTIPARTRHNFQFNASLGWRFD